MGRADRDRQIGVAGVGDRAGQGGGGCGAIDGRDPSVTCIARRDDYADPALDQSVHLDAKRALAGGEPGRVERITKAEIQAVNLDVAAVVVRLLYITDRREKVAHRSGLSRLKHLQAQDLAERGQPLTSRRSVSTMLSVWSSLVLTV